MFVVECPWCGERDQSEFSCHGEAHIVRPPDPDVVTDEVWGDYLFFRNNPKGLHREDWNHAFGCRRFFHVLRHTKSDEIFSTYKPGDPLPDVSEALK